MKIWKLNKKFDEEVQVNIDMKEEKDKEKEKAINHCVMR